MKLDPLTVEFIIILLIVSAPAIAYAIIGTILELKNKNKH